MSGVLSPYYPYEKIYDYSAMPGAEELPKKTAEYLLDLPSEGYEPPDNNAYPRCRIAKYLYYDEPLPLGLPLPTGEEKRSIIYDMSNPLPPTGKGYRVYFQYYVHEAQVLAQTILKIYTGRVIPINSFISQTGIYFDILTSMSYEANAETAALSRTYAIECAIIEALNGVNLGGVGTYYFDRRQHADCGSSAISDEYHNVGRRLCMGVQIEGGTIKN